MNNITILNFRPIKNHPYMRALADLEVNKITLRGLRLEDLGGGRLTLGFPGRKVQGQWQVLYQMEDRQMRALLLDRLIGKYNGCRGKAA